MPQMEVIPVSKITFAPCRPYSYETHERYGIKAVTATVYYDKNGRKRYCANPHHNHCY